MPIYNGSRYQTATIIVEVTEDEVTGKLKEPVRYLSNDRTKFYPENITEKLTMRPKQGTKPDMVANMLYGDPTLWWLVGEFNDFVAKNPFFIFTGDEEIVMPTREFVYREVLPLRE